VESTLNHGEPNWWAPVLACLARGHVLAALLPAYSGSVMCCTILGYGRRCVQPGCKGIGQPQHDSQVID
jgi:hypothetical protein